MNLVFEPGPDGYTYCYDSDAYDGAPDGNNIMGVGIDIKEAANNFFDQLESEE